MPQRDYQCHDPARDGPPPPVVAALWKLDMFRSLPFDGARWSALRGGRTNRLWRVQIGDRDLVVKLFAGNTDPNPLFPNSARDEHAILRRLAGTGLAPQPVALLGTSRGSVLVYHHVPGTCWHPDRAGADGPGGVARLLARLHRIAPPPDLRRITSGPAALRAQTARLLAAAGRHAPPLPEIPVPETPGPEPLTRPPAPALIHTDPVPANLILSPGGVRLIDWQCPAIGDPVEDLAAFLSPAMQVLYGARPLHEDEERAFLAAYPDRSVVARLTRLRPFLHMRMAAYCAWRAARGDRDYQDAIGLELSALQNHQR